MRLSGSIVYEEHVFFWLIIVILLPLTFIFLSIFLYQAIMVPLGTNPAPQWFLLLMTLLFFILTLLFRSYALVLTTDLLIVGFPAYHVKIPWTQIVDAVEEKGSMWRYGGYGIRLGKLKGKSVLVISLPRTNYLRLTLKNARWGYLIVSVKNTMEALNYIHQAIEIYGNKEK